jgi:type IV pilus assembly protein PilY1
LWGGGYDAGGTTGKANNGGYESDTYDQDNGIGAGVYMFSADGADAGNLLWWASNNASATTAATTDSGVIALKDANMKYSVVSEIKTADRNNDGLVDHLYFGDLGGQVFRIDLNNNASTSGAFATRSTRIMNMHASGGTSPRFYAAPSFAIFEDSASGNLFAGISIGSGNLSHPLAGYDSGRHYDALYTIYDKDVTRSDLYTASTMNTQDAAVGATGSLAINELTMANRFQQTEDNMTALVAPYATSSGWYYKLPGGTKIQHEKIFYSPTVIDYDLYVSSYDASRLGLTGACGGGVQGVSKVQIFCMPFGQCSAADYPSRTNTNYSDDHGPGIQNHAIASGGDGTTRLVGGAIIGNNLNDQYATTIKLIAQRWYEK